MNTNLGNTVDFMFPNNNPPTKAEMEFILVNIVMPLIAMGVYPINPADTGLGGIKP